MGTIFKRGKRWGISYVDPRGRQIRKVVSSYKENAQQILKKIEVDLFEGRYLDIKKEEKVLFEDFAHKYLEGYVMLENKNPQKQKYLINGLLKFFKGMYLSQIDSLTIRQYLAQRSKVVKPASVNRDYSMLKSMFNRAIEWDFYRGANPLSRIKKLPENNQRTRWLSENEQEVLLLNCSGMTRRMVLVALKTGMRWSEIVYLKWQQSQNSNYVDFDNNTIFVHESLSKSKKSRHIPLCDSLKKSLLEIERRPKVDYIFWNPKKERRMRNIRKSFETALSKSGIIDFTFHDLRHTFASQLVRKGVDLYVVQKLLGHSNPKMTQRYAHLQEDQLREAIKAVDDNCYLQENNLLYNNVSRNSTILAHRVN